MALFAQDALNDGVKKREVFGWALYDFANSGYTTVVLTAVYAAYFVGGIAQNAAWATFAWTLALSVSYAIVMVCMPVIGARADRLACKKRYLLWATVGCVLGTLALTQPKAGNVALAMLLIVVSNTCFSVAESLSAAFLPELAKRDAMGTVSGWGWSFGYFGGMLALGLGLAYVLYAQAAQLPASHFVPVTLLITAGIYAVASIGTFTLLSERAKPQPGHNASIWSAVHELRQSLAATALFPDFRRLLLCAVFYQAGVAVAIALAAVFAESVVGFKQQETMALIFALNLAAAAGAFAFGYFQDRVGHRKALSYTLVAWMLVCVIAAISTSKGVFWVAAVVAGICMGTSQSAGRAMAGLFAPQHRLAEFYGLWTFATRLASILGPLTYGLITWMTLGNQRLAILSTAAFFAVGIWVLRSVDAERGKLLAAGSTQISR